MALTTTQINQAYLAILGRGAVGTESNVGANASVSSVAASLITAAAKDNSEMFTTLADRVLTEGNGLDNDTFVESLYTTFLNRGSDEEGKAYWLSALNSGMSRKDLVASVIDAIVSQKAANSQDYQNYVAQVTTQANAFVDSLYQNLLGREADADGKAYWISLIADGASYADIAANAAAAALAQGKDTTDGATVANRLEVADYATTNLTSFSKLTTAADIEMIKENLTQTIANITSNAESVAEYKTNIDTVANTYKAPGSVSFTTKVDNLGVDPNTDQFTTSKATDFKGTLNLADQQNKGTIQTNDKVTGNPEFADGNILTVNVTGATKDARILNLNQLPSDITNVNNLVINASNAVVKGTVDTEFTKTVTINAGYTSQTETKASDITVNHKLEIYNAGDKADQLTVAASGDIANIKMGTGNDTIILASGAKVTNIDAGAGTQDKLQLATASGGADYASIKSITGVEIIDLNASSATSGAKIAAAAINGEKITLTNTAGSGSGALTIEMTSADTTLDISKFKNDTTKAVAGVTITGATSGDTITLSQATGDSKIAETVDLAAGAKYIEITNFAKGASGAGVNEGDHVKFASGSVVTISGSGGNISGGYLNAHSIKVTKGFVTFHTEASGSGNAVTINKIEDVQDILTKISGASTLTNKVVAVNIGTDAYLINTGASGTLTTDDIVIKLVGVNANDGIVASGSVVSVLNA